MDAVIKQLEKQSKDEKQKVNIFKTLYMIYHFIAEVFLYSLLIIIIVAALMFALYFLDMIKNIKSGNYKQPLFGAYVIISPSMEPTIKVEDAVVIKRKNKGDLKTGDIITFLSSDSRYAGLTVTHRIVGVEKGEDGSIYYRTKGDNNNTEDSTLVKHDNVYGKVILKIPKIGYIKYVLSTAFGWILLVVIPCLGIVIYDVIKIFKSIGNKDKKQELNKFEEDEEDDEKIEVL